MERANQTAKKTLLKRTQPLPCTSRVEYSKLLKRFTAIRSIPGLPENGRENSAKMTTATVTCNRSPLLSRARKKDSRRESRDENSFDEARGQTRVNTDIGCQELQQLRELKGLKSVAMVSVFLLPCFFCFVLFCFFTYIMVMFGSCC